jgi:alcohol dehydrogenase, propanol-preferring
MHAMVLHRQQTPLAAEEIDVPRANAAQLLLKVDCCAVCRTDLHIVDGELTEPKLPLVPGHQVVGRDVKSGARFGVPWLGSTCGECAYCTSGRENLCDRAKFTGYTLDGGYAEYVVADERFCFPIPDSYSSDEAAPLLCAGLIGYRAYRFAGDARRIGFYGFGSSAHILAQIAKADGREVYAITTQPEFALRMGAVWAGRGAPPDPLDAAILFAPVGSMVVDALRQVVKGGAVICAGIHMTDIPSFPYSLLWGERTLRSVANLTRDDGRALFERLRTLRVHTQRTLFPLEQANAALSALRSGEIAGTAILGIS